MSPEFLKLRNIKSDLLHDTPGVLAVREGDGCLIGDTTLIFTNSKLERGPLPHWRHRQAQF